MLKIKTIAGTTEPSLECDAGFICLRGADSPRPEVLIAQYHYLSIEIKWYYLLVLLKHHAEQSDRYNRGLSQDGVKGKKCPPGNYCLQGALSATPCPAGTFNPYEGGEEVCSLKLSTVHVIKFILILLIKRLMWLPWHKFLMEVSTVQMMWYTGLKAFRM